MTKLSGVEIPFCNNEVYESLSMQSRCILLGMYHLWLANGKKNVGFDASFNEAMGKIISVSNFSYLRLNRNIKAAFAKLYLVVMQHGYTFVFEASMQHGYSKNVLSEIHQEGTSYSNKKFRIQKSLSRIQKSSSRIQKSPLHVQKSPSQIQNNPEKKEVPVIQTPLHDNFING